jgi:hypothetical protein
MSFDTLHQGWRAAGWTRSPTSRITNGSDRRHRTLESTAEAGEVNRCVSGNLVSPPFVDPHFHMDATLSYGLPRINASGTLLEGIALWGELKPLLTHEAVIERALRLLRLGRLNGAARHPHPCRCLRRPAAGSRGAARGAKRSRTISTCSLSPFRRTGFTAHRTRARTPSAPSTGRRCGRRHPAFRAHHGRWPGVGDGSARSPPSAG